jgi:hypothetical protein
MSSGISCHVIWRKFTEVSGKPTASIIRVEDKSVIAVRIQIAPFYETLVRFHQNKRFHVPEHSTNTTPFNVFHVRALYRTKTLITNKCTKRVFIINRNTLLHVSTPLGHLQGELFVTVTLGLHFTVEWECVVDCVLLCFWRVHTSLKMTQQGRNMQECVTIDDNNSLCAFVGD